MYALSHFPISFPFYFIGIISIHFIRLTSIIYARANVAARTESCPWLVKDWMTEDTF